MKLEVGGAPRTGLASNRSCVQSAGEAIEYEAADKEEGFLLRGSGLAAQILKLDAGGFGIPFPDPVGGFGPQIRMFAGEEAFALVSLVDAVEVSHFLDEGLGQVLQMNTGMGGGMGAIRIDTVGLQDTERGHAGPADTLRDQKEACGSAAAGVELAQTGQNER